MKKTRRLIATGALALAAAGASAAGAVVAAPAATAAVASGNYTFTTVNFGVPSTAPASVQNGVLTLHSPIGPVNYQIIDVPGGGYIDSGQGSGTSSAVRPSSAPSSSATTCSLRADRTCTTQDADSYLEAAFPVLGSPPVVGESGGGVAPGFEGLADGAGSNSAHCLGGGVPADPW